MIATRWLATAVAVVATVAGCGTSAAEEAYGISAVMAQPERHQFAAVVIYSRWRGVTGISTILANSSKIEEIRARVYFGDVDSGTVHSVATILVDGTPSGNFGVIFQGWRGDTVYVVSGGDSGMKNHWHRLTASGLFEEVANLPPDLALPTFGGLNSFGLQRFSDSLMVQLRDGGPFLKRFQLDRSGTLVWTGAEKAAPLPVFLARAIDRP